MVAPGVILFIVFVVNSCLCTAHHRYHRKLPKHSSPKFGPHLKIVDGQPVSIEQYPFQISLHARDSFICGGSLIADTWVITAAHCTTGTPASKLKIRAGSSYNDRGGQVVQVEAKFEHPEYDIRNIGNDITVLKLATPVVDKIAKPIHVATKSPPIHQFGTVSGWGVTNTITFDDPDQLMAVTLEVANDNTCLNEYEGDIFNNMFCAGGGSANSCYGDSGGPFAINGTLYGVVSWGHECGGGVPVVYTKIAPFRRFINRVIKTHGHKF